MSFDLPPDMVRRVDESDDALFYAAPRFVAHIDDATREAITEVYRSEIAAGADVLDLMSSWISHLPEEAGYGRVAGQGMNLAELERNPRLTERVVHDLNAAPEIPFENDAFDVVLNAVSVQYLTQPVAVFRSVARVLRPGGKVLIAISHRLFPTKAIYAWQALPKRACTVGGGVPRALRSVWRHRDARPLAAGGRPSVDRARDRTLRPRSDVHGPVAVERGPGPR